MSKMTPDRLAEIKARAEAATPGPWKFVKDKVISTQSDDENIGWCWCYRAENDEFVAHSRTDIPDLIAEVERLRDQIGEVAAASNDYRDLMIDAERENTRLRAELEAAERELAEAHRYIYGDYDAIENGGAK